MKTENWMLELWKWEKHTLNTKVFPQTPEGLIAMTELDLGGLGLTEVPLEIGNLVNLVALDLDKNNLTKTPSWIGNLTNLTALWLNNNNLTGLPKEIGNLTNLTSLQVGYNNLTELPKEIGNLVDLTHFWLKGNNLTKLPDEIGNLVKLINLDLNNNNLTKLSSEIGKLANLTNLWLNGNNLTEIPKEISNLDKLTIFGFDEQREAGELGEGAETAEDYEIRARRDYDQMNKVEGCKSKFTVEIGAVVIGTDEQGNKFEEYDGDYQDAEWEYFKTAQHANERVALINNLKIKDWDAVPRLDSFEEVEQTPSAPSM